ncbi:alpha/beta fold hydrolase [Stackebrandtia nassauensis]|uniref:Alpha/beta hydrolase fold protein n=1 Tax=Stackebrandtia nassauensis (strain DSM 44728 / CIP 108903 / NRRL B-16338 / NBRC 102104 / LLR-40K-21) TaxID=446470 RepID=D3Q344_STANL|nr:alpha/beta hydrolase [Stackebrandtia nassauensis]ADD40014.1 alpha/beta hydrolase fold protein [Stackebrandtia nassauensis DSM 44728]
MTNNSTSSSRLAPPPVGGFAEIDGRRLFVHQSGDGGPAVVFLPGASAIGFDYYLPQQEAAKFATAVIYDRGGSGYSDPMPLPRTAEAVATELRDLLHAQNIPGPYVLVAHSLGGAYAQRFAQLYPTEVAGLVWVDAFVSNWDDFVPASNSLAASEEMAPTREQLEQALPVMREYVTAMFADFPTDVREALVDYHVSDVWVTVGIAERTKLDVLADEINAGPNLPDVPVIALTPVAVDPNQAALMSEEELRVMHDGKIKMHRALVDSVSNGEQRILEDADHSNITFKRVDAVVQAISDVIDRATR